MGLAANRALVGIDAYPVRDAKSPQRWMAPVVVSPHECAPPAETAVIRPVGALVCPKSLLLEDWIDPAVVSPQVWVRPCHPPPETAADWPAGAFVCPKAL